MANAFVFSYTDRYIPLLPKSEASGTFIHEDLVMKIACSADSRRAVVSLMAIAPAHQGFEKLMGCTVPPRIAAHWLSTCVLVNHLERLSLPRRSAIQTPLHISLSCFTGVVLNAGLEVSFHFNVGLPGKSHTNWR